MDADTIAPFVKTGDVWTLGRHRMICGDATDAATIDLLMDGVKANLVVTDPPYNVSYESADGKSIQNDSMSDSKFYDFLLTAFKNMVAHMAEGGSAYIFHAGYRGIELPQSLQGSGLSHQRRVRLGEGIVWCWGVRPISGSMSRCFSAGCRMVSNKWFSDRKQTTVWNFDKPSAARSTHHEPIPLLAYPIKNSSAPNGVVMDLFGGSGSTLSLANRRSHLLYQRIG